jgi:hypothetical protein
MVLTKGLMVLVLFVWQIHTGFAQGMRRTMLEQIAALKGYIITAEKGYRIAQEGLHLVQDIKSGEFGLHEVFFGSLKLVDGGVLGSPELDECYRLIESIDRNFRQAMPNYVSSVRLQTDEVQYILEIQRRAADLGRQDRATMQILTTDGVLSMTDGERIKLINDLMTRIRIRYGYVKRLLTEIGWLIALRQKEGAFIGTLKQWYGIE